MKTVAVLYARNDSVYKSMAFADVYDAARDALMFPGGLPVVAHPPCRAWGRLRILAKPRKGERELAIHALHQVRLFGGVLEHPEASDFWRFAALPRPGEGIDPYGGWTMPVDQFWWGHEARKATWLYVCGVLPLSLPDYPIVLGDAPKVIGSCGRPEISKAAREATPADFAFWLCQLAGRADVRALAY